MGEPHQPAPHTARPDFGRRSDDYLRHRPGIPGSFFDRLERLVPLAGARVLDLGTGPGLTACALARRGATVVGLDVAPNQVAMAVRAAAGAGVEATFRVGPAEATGLPDASQDLVTATQCWGWFDHDSALREVTRVLRPGGLLVVAHFCYLARRSAVAARTEDLILSRNPGWTMAGCTGLYPAHVDGLAAGGLRLVEQFCYDHLEPFTHEAWRGRMRTCNGVGSGVMSDAEVASFDDALADLLRREFPGEPLLIEHRVWATVLRKTGDPS